MTEGKMAGRASKLSLWYRQELKISIRNEDGSFFLLRTLKFSYKVEPLVELYVNGAITKTLNVGWMKKVQVNGEQYNYQFLSDLTGTDRNDIVKIMRPGSGPQSSHTVDLKEGEDVLELTENLMDVYDINSGILHYSIMVILEFDVVQTKTMH